MNYEGIMLSEICQRKINIVCSHLYVESKKLNSSFSFLMEAS